MPFTVYPPPSLICCVGSLGKFNQTKQKVRWQRLSENNNNKKQQLFWPMLNSILLATPVLLSHWTSVLTQPSNEKLKHPLRKKPEVLVCKVSGTGLKYRDFQTTLPPSLSYHGDSKHRRCTTCTSPSEKRYASERQVPPQSL